MGMFDSLGAAQNPQNVQQNPMQMLSQLRQDPVGMLRKAGYNVPDGMNNPNQIAQHLLSTGQVDRNRMTLAQQMARGFSTR